MVKASNRGPFISIKHVFKLKLGYSVLYVGSLSSGALFASPQRVYSRMLYRFLKLVTHPFEHLNSSVLMPNKAANWSALD